jgi:hypothetical protein
MARKFNELRDKMSPQAPERSKAIYGGLLKEMALAESYAARAGCPKRRMQKCWA